jgi:DNA polymerase-3 subunit delta
MSDRTTGSVHLVKGDDPVLLSDAVRTLTHELLGEDADAGLALEEVVLDAGLEDRGLGALLDACLTPPFLTDRRVVVARNAGVLVADDGARLAQYLDDQLDTTDLVLVAGGGTVPQKLVAAVKAKGQIVDAAAPRQAKDRTSWIVDKVRQSPVKLDNRAAQRLAEHLGEDVSRLGGILEVLHAAYGAETVSADQLDPFLGEAGGVAPWDLTDAVDKGDHATALQHLHRLMNGGDRHPLVVMATLHRHYAQMLRLDGAGARDEKQAAQLLGLKGSTFPAKKALTQTRKLGTPKVRRAIALLAEADLDLRGQKSWPEGLVMEVLVARLCQLSRS